jgi:hypothetical protein
MGVTVKPIQTINVRVNSQNQSRVTGTSTFIGSNESGSQANLALQMAQSAYDAANTKVSKSGDTMTGDLIIDADIYASNGVFSKIDGGSF